VVGLSTTTVKRLPIFWPLIYLYI